MTPRMPMTWAVRTRGLLLDDVTAVKTKKEALALAKTKRALGKKVVYVKQIPTPGN